MLTGALLGGHELNVLLGRWGYGLVFAVVALQSLGAPLPGTTALAAAAVYAGSTHRLAIAGVIASAFAGALLGTCLAFAVGRYGGGALLARHGERVGLDAERVSVGRVLLDRYGARVVFFGRFITGLRNVVGYVAGAGGMAWGRFLAACLAAAAVWSLENGLGYYLFAGVMRRASTAVDVVLIALFAVSLAVSAVLVRRRAGAIIAAARSEAQAADRPPDDRPGAVRR